MVGFSEKPSHAPGLPRGCVRAASGGMSEARRLGTSREAAGNIPGFPGILFDAVPMRCHS